MKLAIGSDERTHLTDVVIEEVKRRGHEVELFGPLDDKKEYWPEVARQVAERVAAGEADEGIPYDQEEMARHHARYFRLMETWRERFGDRYFEVEYEDVAGNLEPNARALIDFLGLPWEDACLEFHKQTSAVTTASSVQVRQPAHTRSVGRWRRYEEQLAPTRRALEELGIPLEL